MRRRLFALAAGVSAVLCVAVCVLWVRSTRHSDLVLQMRRENGWYFLRSDAGRLVLMGPRSFPPLQIWTPEQLAQVAVAMDNSELVFRTDGLEYANGYYPLTPMAFVGNGSGAIPSLLDALQDPRRFAIAHAVLVGMVDEHQMPVDVALLNPPGDLWHGLAGRADDRGVCQFDPAQMPALERRWRTAFAVESRAVSYRVLTSALAILPGSWVASLWLGRMRARRTRRLGLCPACGYDLRATPGRCPECGAVPAEATRATPPPSRG